MEEANCSPFPPITSSLSCFHIARTLMLGLAMSNADNRQEHLSPWWKKPLHIVAKMLLSGLFLNIYNFKLPRLKTSNSYCPRWKKDRISQRLLVHSYVPFIPSYKQVFWRACSILRFSTPCPIFFGIISHRVVLSQWLQILFWRLEDKIFYELALQNTNSHNLLWIFN